MANVTNPFGAQPGTLDTLVDWATLTEHTAGTEYIVTLPVNADVITSEGAIAGLNYIATPRTDRPDTIATMDDTEFDNNWDIVGVFRQSGASIRDLTGVGTLYFNPLVDLSNARVDEFIDWQTFGFTQDILFALDPASITEWQDYTGNNLAQPAAINDTFTLTEHTRLRATRVGNAVKISLHPLEQPPGGVATTGLQREIYSQVAGVGVPTAVTNLADIGVALQNGDEIRLQLDIGSIHAIWVGGSATAGAFHGATNNRVTFTQVGTTLRFQGANTNGTCRWLKVIRAES